MRNDLPALAAKLGVTPEEVAVGNGSNELLELMVRTFLGDGDETLTSANSFVVYRLASQAHGRTCVEAPLRDHRYDLRAIRERLSPRTKLVFLANPDNPTGSSGSNSNPVPGAKVQFDVAFHAGRRHLPVVSVKRAA